MQLFCQPMEWGLELTGWGRPIGLGIDRQQRLLVTDMDCHTLVRFDADYRHYQCHSGPGAMWDGGHQVCAGTTTARPKHPARGWNGPHGVVADGAGSLLVTCYYDPMIVAVAPGGAARTLIGHEYLKGPATTQLDKQGRLLVAEYALNLLLAFGPNGDYLGRLGLAADGTALAFDTSPAGVTATQSMGGFDRLHMAVSVQDSSILVADTWNNRLQRFSNEGTLLDWLADGQGWTTSATGPLRTPLPHIDRPVAIDQRDSGQLLVTAWGSSKVSLLASNGMPIETKELPRLNKPYDARFLGEGIVIADTHNGRVLVVDKI